MSSQRDQGLAKALRRAIDQPGPGSREALAGCLVGYMQAYLAIYLRRRRFGFGRPIAEVTTDVADSEIAALLVDADNPIRIIEKILPLVPKVGASPHGDRYYRDLRRSTRRSHQATSSPPLQARGHSGLEGGAPG